MVFFKRSICCPEWGIHWTFKKPLFLLGNKKVSVDVRQLFIDVSSIICVSSARSSKSLVVGLFGRHKRLVNKRIINRLTFKFVLGWDKGCLSPNPENGVDIGFSILQMPCLHVLFEIMTRLMMRWLSSLNHFWYFLVCTFYRLFRVMISDPYKWNP